MQRDKTNATQARVLNRSIMQSLRNQRIKKITDLPATTTLQLLLVGPVCAITNLFRNETVCFVCSFFVFLLRNSLPEAAKWHIHAISRKENTTSLAALALNRYKKEHTPEYTLLYAYADHRSKRRHLGLGNGASAVQSNSQSCKHNSSLHTLVSFLFFSFYSAASPRRNEGKRSCNVVTTALTPCPHYNASLLLLFVSLFVATRAPLV